MLAIVIWNLAFDSEEIYVESAIFSKDTDDINEKFDNFVILEVNNDDNTYKQISVEDFLKKIKNIESINHSNVINYDSIAINVDNSHVYKDGIKIDLSEKEYKMLRLFVDNKGKVLANEQIINCVWGIAYANAGMLRVAINRLRNKVDPNNEYIKTIRGKGYMLEDL